jgi:hypothetical protein
MGQMNLACTHCHDRNFGRKLLNDTLSQGHGNPYPRTASSGKPWVRCIAGCARVFLAYAPSCRRRLTGFARSGTFPRVARARVEG